MALEFTLDIPRNGRSGPHLELVFLHVVDIDIIVEARFESQHGR